MPTERIDITISNSRIAADAEHRRLLQDVHQRKRPARTPIVLNTDPFFCLLSRNASIPQYLSSPRENIRGQLLNLKWRTENFDDDQPLPLTEFSVSPDFGSIRGTQFPITWHESDAGPWVGDPLITQVEQIDSLTIPAPAANLNAKRIAWYHDMQTLIHDFDLRLNGQPLQLSVSISHGGGPIPTAFALASENLFEFMAADPDRTHRFMQLCSDSHFQCVEHHNFLAGRPKNGPVWAGCDSAEMISPAMFKEFVVPYYLQLWTRFPGPRTFHMCGRINHLLDILRDEMKITTLDGFGFPVPPELLAEKLAGRVNLKGGFSPVLLHAGPADAIRSETLRYLRLLAPTGGFIMSNGGSAVVGTPPAHFQALITTTREFTC
ncbi:MAG: uroporphyrinogen decarboxylase family protein [Phycisphaerales bacterium]|nr:uroporphyrinogen decarboxylase family protein [Phycisphaerales bacterium]